MGGAREEGGQGEQPAAGEGVHRGAASAESRMGLGWVGTGAGAGNAAPSEFG